jgi:hypothetical protein
MIRNKCARGNIFNINNFFKFLYFRTFLGLVAASSDILFAAVHPLPEGISELVFSDGLDYSIRAHLEALLGR